MGLVDLVSAEVSLTRRGKEWVGPCVFCGTGTDRFIVWPATDRYYCRRCNKKGDQIQFLRDYRNLSFRDACKVVGKELQPDPRWARRRQIKTDLEAEYLLWARAQWRDLLALTESLAFDISVAEIAYCAVIRAPALWTDNEQTTAIETLSALYARRELLNNRLDLLQSSRHEAEVQSWWRQHVYRKS